MKTIICRGVWCLYVYVDELDDAGTLGGVCKEQRCEMETAEN
jgi:hypothetical protein